MTLSVSLELQFTAPISQEALYKGMTILGELVLNEIKQQIRSMDLIVTGQLLQGWVSRFDGQTLYIENTQHYMIYLEYGTYAYFDSYGERKFPIHLHPKKKDMPRELAKMFPKGMQPFAFIRRVLYNQAMMQRLAHIAFT